MTPEVNSSEVRTNIHHKGATTVSEPSVFWLLRSKIPVLKTLYESFIHQLRLKSWERELTATSEHGRKINVKNPIVRIVRLSCWAARAIPRDSSAMMRFTRLSLWDIRL
jgi:hypothetical protein